jgi:hypothetical protein
VLDGTAKICDSGHPLLISVSQEWRRRDALHIDVDGMLHNRGQQTTTVITAFDAKAAGQNLAVPDGYLDFGKIGPSSRGRAPEGRLLPHAAPRAGPGREGGGHAQLQVAPHPRRIARSAGEAEGAGVR